MAKSKKHDSEWGQLYYEMARTELVERITLRDQSLIAYVVAAGTYFGFIVQERTSTDAVADVGGAQSVDTLLATALTIIVLPVISLVFAFVMLQHHVMIGKIGEYLREEFPAVPRHWDQVYAAWPDKRYLNARTISQGILVLIPLLYTGLFAIQTLPSVWNSPAKLAIILGFLALDSAFFVVILRAHLWAFNMRKSTDLWAPKGR